MTTASTCEALIASDLFCRVRGTIFTGKEKPRRSGAKVTDQPSSNSNIPGGEQGSAEGPGTLPESRSSPGQRDERRLVPT